MSGGRNQRALLMEILIAVLFFGLCATVLLQTFTAAWQVSRRAGVQSEALTELQSTAEYLYAAGDMAVALAELGFVPEDGEWVLRKESFDVRASLSREECGAGALHNAQLKAIYMEETVADLPVARYVSGEESR